MEISLNLMIPKAVFWQLMDRDNRIRIPHPLPKNSRYPTGYLLFLFVAVRDLNQSKCGAVCSPENSQAEFADLILWYFSLYSGTGINLIYLAKATHFCCGGSGWFCNTGRYRKVLQIAKNDTQYIHINKACLICTKWNPLIYDSR